VKTLLRSLYFQVLVAITLGVLLGALYPATGAMMKPFGDGFIKLIKMLIAPVIFCTVVTGIAGVEDMKKVGSTGGLALIYFEVMSTVALAVGLLVVNIVRPGSGMNVDPRTLDTSSVAAYTGPGKLQSVTEFLLNVPPAWCSSSARWVSWRGCMASASGNSSNTSETNCSSFWAPPPRSPCCRE
jgi:aerobic C4-dicarboxylate transport protein